MTNLWMSNKWKNYYNEENLRSGLRLKFDQGVDPEVKRSCKEFCQWMRSFVIFPIRVPVYVKQHVKLRTLDGDLAYGAFFMPDDRKLEPYIRIATGDFRERMQKIGRDNALASILETLAHELTHYFQWINHIELTNKGCERQASNYADLVLNWYAQEKDHP